MSVCEQMDRADGPIDVDSAREAGAKVGYVEIRVKGKTVRVPSASIGAATVIAPGKWLRIAALKDEELMEGERVPDPELFLSRLKDAGLKADIFTFAQKLPDVTPRHTYYFEWDNLAVIPLTSFKDWWAQLSDPVQRAVKKAKRVGVVVKEMEFNDAFVEGIRGINNETPVRQGRAFWHYQKDFEAVKAENSTYEDRNIFIGAYLGDELIGFVRMVGVGDTAEIINILSKMQHYDKRPANALLAKAVEVCEQRGFVHLVYCNYVYRDPNSSLTEFKRRNRFEQVLVPRYYIPLTLRGRIALALRLHHGLKALLPLAVIRALVGLRSWLRDGIVVPLTKLSGRLAGDHTA
jgi:hypothetical protein